MWSKPEFKTNSADFFRSDVELPTSGFSWQTNFSRINRFDFYTGFYKLIFIIFFLYENV